jgi:heme/copper-type cytochrome/quinol oxidase subunit 2
MLIKSDAETGNVCWFLGALAALSMLSACRCERGAEPLPELVHLEVSLANFQPSPAVLALPVGVPAELHLRSADYIYAFQSPGLGVNVMAVPGVDTVVEIAAGEVGEYLLLGNPMCGRPHSGLAVVVKVVPVEDYLRVE